MVIHNCNKHLIVLIPKVNINLVRFVPANIDDHKHHKEVAVEDLEVSKTLQIDEGSCKDDNPHHANKWFKNRCIV